MAMRQIYLVRSWRVSFYVTNKSCCIRKISRVDDSSHKLRQILRQYRWSSISRSPISSPESAILLDCARNRDLWASLKARQKNGQISDARAESNRNQDFLVPVLDSTRAHALPDRWSRGRGLWGRDCPISHWAGVHAFFLRISAVQSHYWRTKL